MKFATTLLTTTAIQKALTAEDVFLKRDKERYLYEMREKALRDQISALYYAKQEGVVEGKKEIAVRMLGKGSSIEDIVEITGLSLEQVMQLKN